MATDDWTPLVFTQDGVPTWEVRYDVRQSPARGGDLIVNGTADSFDAAKAAALHEASIQTAAKPAHRR